MCAVQTSHALAVESLYPRIEKGIAAALEKLLLDERKAEPDELGVTARMSARQWPCLVTYHITISKKNEYSHGILNEIYL